MQTSPAALHSTSLYCTLLYCIALGQQAAEMSQLQNLSVALREPSPFRQQMAEAQAEAQARQQLLEKVCVRFRICMCAPVRMYLCMCTCVRTFPSSIPSLRFPFSQSSHFRKI